MRNVADRLKRRLWLSRAAMYGFFMPLGFSLALPTLEDAATSIWRIAYVLFGFSLIIFLHELGHFLVARACGVKCLAFSLGIGPRMLGWRKNGGLTLGADRFDPEIMAKRAAKKDRKASGEKDGEKHSLKTLESDLPTSAVDPAEGKVVVHTAEGKVEIEPETKNLTDDILGRKRSGAVELGHTDYRVSWLPLGGYVRMLGQDDMDPTKVSTDPRAFNQRPIWQRMCIVSAGVTMNIIFAVVTFSILFSPGMGVAFPPAEVGTVVYDSPAWKHGLRMGDKIVGIDGQKPTRGFLEFTDVKLANALSWGDRDIDYIYERPGEAEERKVSIRPSVGEDGFLGIGIDPMPGLHVAPLSKLREDVEARKKSKKDGGRGEPEAAAQIEKLQSGDVIARVDGKPVENYLEMFGLIQAAGPRPVQVELKNPNPKVEEHSITLTPEMRVNPGVEEFPALFGIGPQLRIEFVEPGSGAAKAKMEAGDVIERIGEREQPTIAEFRRIAKDSGGQTLKVLVRRGTEALPLDVKIAGASGSGVMGVLPGNAFDDMAVQVRDATVAGLPPELQSKSGDMRLVKVDGKPVQSWDEAVWRVEQKKAGEEIAFSFAAGAAATQASTQAGTQAAAADVTATFTVTEPVLTKLHDQLAFLLYVPVEMKTQTQRAASVQGAVMMGLDHTKKFVEQVYMTLAGLAHQTVSASNLHGMLGISKVGYDVQEKGQAWFWYLMAIVSVNLAVANFLPLPIVDGGLFLLLILEKIRGKPLSLKLQSAIQVVGIVLLAGLFLFVTWNDLNLFK